MPELPEVETIKRQLGQAITGLRIADVEVLKPKSFLGAPRQIVGLKVVGVERRAKVSLIQLEKGLTLAVHLKMTGQLIWREPNQNQIQNKYTRVVIRFDNGGKLYFNDLRLFGWIKIIKSKIKDDNLGLGKYGPEAIDEKAFSLDYFQGLLAKSGRPIKLVVMDQEKLAGVGNIYANEALFRAKVRPSKPAKELTVQETRRLRQKIIRVLQEAIKHQGTSDRDEAFRQLSGEKGRFQDFLQVYGRAGRPCPRCQSPVKRVKIGGRGTFYCPKCQE